VKPFGKFIHSA